VISEFLQETVAIFFAGSRDEISSPAALNAAALKA
jgi:hypothetical protein